LDENETLSISFDDNSSSSSFIDSEEERSAVIIYSVEKGSLDA